uniref:Uncharacterized protein n=1 Tax=Anguilla anguilla TaxID=7936 RepID=A0A0E9QQ77_ANGAN
MTFYTVIKLQNKNYKITKVQKKSSVSRFG